MINYKNFSKYCYYKVKLDYNIRMIIVDREGGYLINVPDVDHTDWYDKRWYVDA